MQYDAPERIQQTPFCRFSSDRDVVVTYHGQYRDQLKVDGDTLVKLLHELDLPSIWITHSREDNGLISINPRNTPGVDYATLIEADTFRSKSSGGLFVDTKYFKIIPHYDEGENYPVGYTIVLKDKSIEDQIILDGEEQTPIHFGSKIDMALKNAISICAVLESVNYRLISYYMNPVIEKKPWLLTPLLSLAGDLLASSLFLFGEQAFPLSSIISMGNLLLLLMIKSNIITIQESLVNFDRRIAMEYKDRGYLGSYPFLGAYPDLPNQIEESIMDPSRSRSIVFDWFVNTIPFIKMLKPSYETVKAIMSSSRSAPIIFA